MAADPRAPKIERWLRSLEPRQELVLRFAMRSRFPEVRGDRAITGRVEELRDKLHPDESQLAMMLADAREVAKHVEELIGKAPPETRTRARIKKARGASR